MFLKNKNIIFKIRRSKVTDYAALSGIFGILSVSSLFAKVLVNHFVEQKGFISVLVSKKCVLCKTTCINQTYSFQIMIYSCP